MLESGWAPEDAFFIHSIPQSRRSDLTHSQTRNRMARITPNWLPSLVSLLLVWLAARAIAAEAFPSGLRCEHRADPSGIDRQSARLGWQIAADGRGQRQTAYRILVASSLDTLARHEGDLWDSGRVDSGNSVDIPYAGQPLATHAECFWKTMVWNDAGEPSAWSEPARWSMGILDPADWQADWIGLEQEIPKRFVADTNWIWFPDAGPAEALPPGVRFFRRAFTIPADHPITSAVLRITADDPCTIFLDGREIGSRSGGHATKEMDLTYRLTPGPHLLAVRAENRGDAVRPAGLIARLQIDFAAGEPLVVRADESWLSSKVDSPGWQMPGFDAVGWRPARVLGPVGIAPWGQVQQAEERRLPARYLRREFTAAKPIRRAMLSWCGQGLSEVSINGRRVNDHVLSPALAEYPKRLWYLTEDVTDLVREGPNCLGVILGNGRFFAPRSQVYANMPTYGLPKVLLHLRLEHADGTVALVTSDDAWQVTDDGPIRANNEFDGEEYDARLSLGGWDQPGYAAAAWHLAEVVPAPSGILSAQPIEPIRIVDRLQPRTVTTLPSGVHVFDLGQNIAGWCRLRMVGPAGTQVTLHHAERLHADGSLDMANLRGARATDCYTLAGSGEETWEPRFTSHGFRYVGVSGVSETPPLDAIAGCVVHDDLRAVGTIETSSEILNQIYRNAVWGFRGNYRSVPTDCPQRDERQAWLGDRLGVARGEAYAFDTQAFYAKWLQDIADTQRADGVIPDVCPAHWPAFTDNVVWPSAAILVAATQLRQFGDRDVIARHYPCFVRWLDHMLGLTTDGLIDRDAYGDWCVPPEDPAVIHSQDPARRTAPALLATAFLAHDLEIVARFADLLAKPDDAARFRAESARIKAAFQRRFFDDATGFYDNGTQTACVLPLAFGLVPPDHAAGVIERLVERIEGPSCGHIGTGLVGGQFLYQTLTRSGRPDLAFQIASQKTYPSLGYMAEQGATTVWELWNGNTADPAMNSGNHVMLVGDLVTWMYEDLAGIAPATATDGFRTIRMQPCFPAGLDFVKARYDSHMGPITSHWLRTPTGIRWDVTLPANTSAEVILSPAAAHRLSIDGEPQSTPLSLPLTLPSGTYRLEF